MGRALNYSTWLGTCPALPSAAPSPRPRSTQCTAASQPKPLPGLLTISPVEIHNNPCSQHRTHVNHEHKTEQIAQSWARELTTALSSAATYERQCRRVGMGARVNGSFCPVSACLDDGWIQKGLSGEISERWDMHRHSPLHLTNDRDLADSKARGSKMINSTATGDIDSPPIPFL